MRAGSLFAGYGGLDLAVNAYFGATTAWFSESDPAPSRILAHHWPDVPNHGDITRIDWTAVEPIDILCGGFPCFPAGTLIDAGEDGYRPIETLRVGDLVLTHERRRRAVTSVMRREADDVLNIKAMGAPAFRATSEHPFYVRRRLPGRPRRWSTPEWVDAGELRPGDMLAMPLDDATSDPFLGGPDVAYLVGRWLGDGWIVDHARAHRVNSRVHKAIICCARGEADGLASSIKRAGFHATRSDERTVTKFHISSERLVKMLRPFGQGAGGKRLPGAAFTAPQDERAALLQGWLDADGSQQKCGAWRGTTVSENLAHGMARLARNVYRRATSVHRFDVPDTTVIEGREVRQRPQYQVVVPPHNREAITEAGFVWVPLRSVTEAEPCEVFNVSVDEDESYTAYGYTVHNCQDVSAAGRRAGIRDGTRSGLWSYFAEAINQLRPKYVVIENVRGLLSAEAHRVESDPDAVGDGSSRPILRALGAVLGDLSDIGYDAQWTTVAAASVGACHRRERVFILATPADAERGGCGGDARASRRGPGRRATATGGCEGGNRGDAVSLLPTPRTSDTNGPGAHGDGGLDLRTAVVEWGDYEPAIRRAELACGRLAPSPTEPNRNGNPRLSARFAEWMMMLPDGWVTDPAIGLSRNGQLKAIGNGVVPAQAYAALTQLVLISLGVA